VKRNLSTFEINDFSGVVERFQEFVFKTSQKFIGPVIDYGFELLLPTVFFLILCFARKGFDD
jgi:hypothetical protein